MVLRRRFVLAMAAGIGAPLLARAQEVPAPELTPTPAPNPMPITAAPPIPAQPMRMPATMAPGTIDKSKMYYLFFDQAIDIASMRLLRRQLAVLVDAGVTDIHLVIDSLGGQIEPTVVTYGFIRALPARITTHAQSFVGSAATILFLAGEDRTADASARFLFHPWQAIINGNFNEAQMQQRLADHQTITAMLSRIYRERSQLTDQQIAQFDREEVWFTAEQALAAGIVQSVADLRVPGEQKARIVLLD